MEARLLVKYCPLAAILCISSLGVSLAENESKDIESFHHQHQDLRLYRINKDGISNRFWFTRSKAKKTGCHNLRKKSRLHRAVQFGYPVCRIYTKKHCEAGSAVTFTREDLDVPTSALTQGYSWFAVSEHARGEKVKSWYCGDNPR